ncbi:MAG: Uma2 family endonuclease [Solirubrobacteraceae bacterium]|nr:Uma2 family endonuclease [Solirubrobacteraceae bacterium]
MAVAQRMTVAEFHALPEQRWATLIEGEVVVNQPRALHQRVVLDLVVALTLWTRDGAGRGEVTSEIAVELDEHNWFGPDVMWYRGGREPGRSETAPQPMPDIAAEVRSPSTWRYDIGPKMARYEQYGLPELWLVDTAADVILVYRRSTPQAATFDVCLELARGDALTSPLLPGLALPLDELFGPPPAATG